MIINDDYQAKGVALAERRPHEKLWDEGRWKEMSPLEIENMLLRELVDYLKVMRRGQANLLNRQKTEFGENIRKEKGLPLHTVASFLNISKSTYEYNKNRLSVNRDDDIRDKVKEIFFEGKCTWGYRTIWAKLRRENIFASEKRVRRVMSEEGLKVIYLKKRRRYSSYAGEISKAPENLVKRKFQASRPNELWLSDITEFKLSQGRKVYLSPVLDCFDGCPISWSIGTHPTAELANSSLQKALEQRSEGEKTIIHTDRGGHYRWPTWIKMCKQASLIRSMSAKGCSPDNSACEGFFGTLKNEFFYYRDWKSVSTQEFIEQLGRYLCYFRDTRIKKSLGWLSPKEYRKSLNYAV